MALRAASWQANFMDRAAVGLGSACLHLKAEVKLHYLFHDLIDDFLLEGLAKRRGDVSTEACIN
jgi:hypothetical protein